MGVHYSRYRQVHHDVLPQSENNSVSEANANRQYHEPRLSSFKDGYEPRLSLIESEEGDNCSRDGQEEIEQEVRWKRGALIGNGAYGDVYLALCESDGSLMAVKCLSIHERNSNMDRMVGAILSEIETLRSLNHSNIVQYRGTEISDDELHIFMDYVPGGSIASLLKKFGPFPEPLIAVYMKQILDGLAYLHKNKVIHRDLKGANILVDTEGICKLADFGASRKLDELVTEGELSIKGTPYWMAPEMIKSQSYGYPADIWSIGCTFIEMATARPPWTDPPPADGGGGGGPAALTHVQAIYRIATSAAPPALPPGLSPTLREAAMDCLKRTAEERPTAAALRRHRFFQAADEEEEEARLRGANWYDCFHDSSSRGGQGGGGGGEGDWAGGSRHGGFVGHLEGGSGGRGRADGGGDGAGRGPAGAFQHPTAAAAAAARLGSPAASAGSQSTASDLLRQLSAGEGRLVQAQGGGAAAAGRCAAGGEEPAAPLTTDRWPESHFARERMENSLTAATEQLHALRAAAAETGPGSGGGGGGPVAVGDG